MGRYDWIVGVDGINAHLSIIRGGRGYMTMHGAHCACFLRNRIINNNQNCPSF